MIIKADKEAIEAIKAVCDIAIKSEGLNILQGINSILYNMKEVAPEVKESK